MTPKTRLTKARAALICDQPFFGALALKLNLEQDPAAETAWTDGKSLGYNPDYIESLPLDQLKGLVAHEVMHLALCHHTRQGQRDFDKWNVAGDYAINQTLIDSGFKLPDGALLCSAYQGKSSEAIYDLLGNGQGPVIGQGQGLEPKPMGEVRPLPGDPTPAEKKLEEQAWKIAVTQATQLATAMGKEPGQGVTRTVKQALAPRVDWQAALQDFMERAVRSDYCWMKPNPRYVVQGIFLPGLSGKEVGTIAVAIDTSGSVSPDQLCQFSSEVSAMLEVFDTSLELIYADSKVQGQEAFTRGDLPLELALKGGGGTNYRPVFELLEDQGMAPSCLVYLTDMQCSRYPDKPPDYPVLWVNTEPGHGSTDPPFGRVIDMG